MGRWVGILPLLLTQESSSGWVWTRFSCSPLGRCSHLLCVSATNTHNWWTQIYPENKRGKWTPSHLDCSHQTNILPTRPHPGLIPPSCLSPLRNKPNLDMPEPSWLSTSCLGLHEWRPVTNTLWGPWQITPLPHCWGPLMDWCGAAEQFDVLWLVDI